STEEQKVWHGGRAAVQRFFGPSDDKHGRTMWREDPRERATLQFLIVTVPDPVDSGLPHVYDRYMAAVQAAVQTQPYFLSKFDLPWEDCLSRGKGKSNQQSDDDAAKTGNQGEGNEQQPKAWKERRYRKEPGFLLLNNPKGDKTKIDLLLVYLVGETPTAGIQKRALIAALNEISWFCGWRDNDRDPA